MQQTDSQQKLQNRSNEVEEEGHEMNKVTRNRPNELIETEMLFS